MDFPIETTIHDKSIIHLYLHSFSFGINHTKIQQQNTRNLAYIKDNRHHSNEIIYKITCFK